MSKESLVESALDRAPDLARKLVWAETPAQLIKIYSPCQFSVKLPFLVMLSGQICSSW